eukprot:1680581-Prymnesium_polylepis.1
MATLVGYSDQYKKWKPYIHDEVRMRRAYHLEKMPALINWEGLQTFLLPRMVAARHTGFSGFTGIRAPAAVRRPAASPPTHLLAARCYRARYNLSASLSERELFDDYLASGGGVRLWGCAPNYKGSVLDAELAPRPIGPADHGCRLGCCIFVVDLGFSSTSQRAEGVVRPGTSGPSKGTWAAQTGPSSYEYAQDYYLHSALLRSPQRTTDPSAADYFYVASYESLSLGENGDDLRLVMGSRWWRERGGANF